jgi:hypothetical protein
LSGRARRQLGVGLLAGVAVTACAPRALRAPRPAAPPLRSATLAEVLEAYEQYCEGIETLSASGDLDVRDLRAGKAQKLGVRVLASRGGRLYLKGSVAVLTALELVSDGRRFWFQVPSRRTVWTGAADGSAPAEGEGDAPYYALRPRDVTLALVPEPLAPRDGEALVMEADAASFSLTVASLAGGRGVARMRISVGRASLLPARLRSYDARGDLAAEVDFGGYQDGLPRRVAIRRPGEGYEASFTFSKAERNVALPERAFAARLPDGFKVLEVP